MYLFLQVVRQSVRKYFGFIFLSSVCLILYASRNQPAPYCFLCFAHKFVRLLDKEDVSSAAETDDILIYSYGSYAV